MNVLIIEDDERLIELYEAFELGSEPGTKIHISKTGKDALKFLEKAHPDVVLIDMLMPDISGLDILKYLHDTGTIQKTKAYILTNLTEDATEKKAKKLGASGYIIKSNISYQVMKNLIEKGVPE